MLTLSIQQPWAWLIANGFKDVENRDWQRAPSYRGPVLIHAGLKTDRAFPRTWAEQLCGRELPAYYQTGGIVGKARLVDVVRQSDSPWFFGSLGLVFAEAQPLPFTPLRGQLGLFEVDEGLLEGQPAPLCARWNPFSH